MVIVNAPLRADLFREKAESLGLVYVSKVGMKLSFNAPIRNVILTVIPHRQAWV